jgi:hypothetical protein
MEGNARKSNAANEKTASLGIVELLRFTHGYYSKVVYLDMCHILNEKLNLRDVMEVSNKDVLKAIKTIDREQGGIVLWKGDITLTDMLTISDFLTVLVDYLTRLGNRMPGRKVPDFKDSVSLQAANEGLSREEILARMDKSRKAVYQKMCDILKDDIEYIVSRNDYYTMKSMEEIKSELGDSQFWKKPILHTTLKDMLKLSDFSMFFVNYIDTICEEAFGDFVNLEPANIESVRNTESVRSASEEIAAAVANEFRRRQLSRMRSKSASRASSRRNISEESMLRSLGEVPRRSHARRRSRSINGTRRRNRASRNVSA